MDCRQIASSPSGRSNIAMRPLILSQRQIRVSILVSTSIDEWISAEVLRDEFLHEQSRLDTANLENQAEATVELAARFLGFVAQNLHQSPARTALLLNVFKHFTSTARSALLTAVAAKKASVFALFGGQGTNEVYFDELQSLYDIYKPFVSEFLATVTNGNALLHYTFGLDVLSWLSGTSPRPSTTYLASVPISFPLIGLTQPIQYLAACNVAGMSPGQYRDTISGATGQSQGIVSAVAIAASGTYQSFCANAVKAVKWLFFRGLRGQQAFPIVALEPGIVQDSIEGGEGVPMPMLSVTGLQLDELAVYIKKTNAHLAENAQLSVSLHNGPHAFVVPGPARSLFGLTPFSQRKPVFSARFLAVGVPYHSGYLAGATEKLIEDLGGEELWKTGDLKIPVFNTKDGTDLRQLSTSITKSLCEQVFTKPVHWTAATNFPENATHAVDFGPSGLSGIGPLTAKNLDGRGVRVIVVGDRTKGDPELYNAQNVRYEESWNKFAPGLVKTSDGTMYLDTRFSRLLGKPPIMVAGMTPSTVQTGFVSAVLNAGYHVELAGGGHYNATALHTKVVEIQSKIPAGIGITLNALYINQRQFGFQLPLWQEMRKEGLPIEGFCVAAGIPSPEKAAEIIEGLKSAGIRHVAFKPGSVEGIRQVVNIAGANPGFPIILRWTGGRAGDHHSYEDFHWPVLQTYRAIRQQANISLVGGSGFGVAEDVWPYFSGEWSAKYDMQPMPFDSFLFASRVMVAKEAHTSPSVKDLIVAAAGVEEAECEGTYVKPTGGILTVKSELGGPIHKVATRGVKLWKEFDDTVFKLPKEKRVAWLVEHREEVIGKLNKDFSKPWFEWKDGSVANELNDMTMVQLMFVAHEKRWVDILLGNLTGDWLRRIEERFAGAYPIATRQLLASEDSAFFLAIAQCLGQKPVPFIPVLDASFEVWFKKDSLWAAEDIEAVFDQDPQRVCILQGPMAVKHSKVKDEPIKDLLGNINSALIQRLLEFRYAGDESKAPTVDYLSAKPAALPAVANVERSETNGELRALARSTTIIQGTSYIDNPMSRLLAPRPGKRSLWPTTALRPSMLEDRRDVSVPLTLQFEYKPSLGFAPVHELAAGRNTRIKEFYWKLWYGDDAVLPDISIRETFHGPEVTIEASAVEQSCAVVGNQGESFKMVRNDQVSAPMDFAIVTGWQAIMKSIFPSSIDGDLLKLVHLSNGFRMVDGAKPLQAGDVCKAEAHVVSVANTDAGKVVKVMGRVFRAGKSVIDVTSAFLYRGRLTDYENTFKTTEEPDYIVALDTDVAVGVLQSKEWFEWLDESKPLLPSTSLIFRVKSKVLFKDETSYRDISVSSDIFMCNQTKVLVLVGSLNFHQEDSHGNPVAVYLQRHGTPQGLLNPLPNEAYTLTSGTTVFNAPLTNEPYSKISGDFNPININPYFSDYASLPATITHGLWSSAAVAIYDVSFAGMVLPGDELSMKIPHIGMRDGNFAVNIVTSNTRGEKVLEGSAEVSQPTTVYVFTGQGSQEAGMGMDLYN
ncbi:hypothetical protein C8R45DRAFT_1058526 [Mycena sanguinolenta]|nr:hypothetical protein C8R45DRAFT_1058526 [Mycena sanguinolenta]